MIKKTLLTAIIVALSFNTGYVAYATNLSPETQAIEENKIKFVQLDDEITSLNSEISKLNMDIEELNYRLQENNTEVEQTDLQIKLINSQIEETKASIEKNQEILDKRLRSMYKGNPATDMLIYIITSDNILDAFDRMYSMSKIISLDKQVIDEINEQNEFLLKSAEDLNKKQLELKALQESVEKDLSILSSKQLAQEEKLDKLNSEKANVAEIIEENEKKLISHQLSIINSDNSTEDQLKSAINTLESLIPQLSSDYVIGLANTAISDGKSILESIEIEKSKISESNNSNNINDSSNSNEPNNSNSTSDIASDSSNSNSSNATYLSTYTMESTAYTGGTLTATGLKPVRDPNGLSTIAVDPNVIPLGSKVFIPGYGYAIASDTGNDIKGNIIDVYLNSNDECIAWGRKSVTVHIVALPGTW